MEKRTAAIGIGLLALALAAPFAYARMMGDNWQPAELQAAEPGQAAAGQDWGWYEAMSQMHNLMHGTGLSLEEFKELHGNGGCQTGGEVI